jgi:serine/threonine protein kinase
VATSEPFDQPDPDRSDLTSAATNDVTHTGIPVLPLDAPTQWDEFRILRELGRGGFGCVYSAYDAGLAKEIALKIVRVSHPLRMRLAS